MAKYIFDAHESRTQDEDDQHSDKEESEADEDDQHSDNEESEEEESEDEDDPHSDNEESDDEEAKQEAPPTQTYDSSEGSDSRKTLNSPIISKSKGMISNPDRVSDSNVVEKNKYSKRAAPDENYILNVSKKRSKTRDDDVEDKKFGIGKVWSENDEITLLQAMIDYKAETHADPNLNLSDFHVFVDPLLTVHGSKTRLSEKLRRLKNKYKINVENGCVDTDFSKPHERRLFELSNKIWGGKSKANHYKLKSTKKKDEDAGGTTTDLLSLFTRLSKAIELEASTQFFLPKDTKDYVREMISAFGNEKARELEEEWEVISIMEYDLYAKRADMNFKQTLAMLDVVKRSMSQS